MNPKPNVFDDKVVVKALTHVTIIPGDGILGSIDVKIMTKDSRTFVWFIVLFLVGIVGDGGNK